MHKALGMHGIIVRFSSKKKCEKDITLVIHYHEMEMIHG
jgi:hypothetical protein